MPELRYDPFRGRWVIVSPDRARRPEDYKVEKQTEIKMVSCPFCEGNEDKTPPEIFAIRQDSAAKNAPGWKVRVVPNKYPALRIEDDAVRYGVGMFDVVSGAGAHEVIIETPDHNGNLADLSIENIKDVLFTFKARLLDLFNDDRLRYLLVFKNHQFEAGASLAHTHSQLIAMPMVPQVMVQELTAARNYYEHKERCIICDLIGQELSLEKRIVNQNNNYVVWAPFASSFPFEVWLLPKNHSNSFTLLSDNELYDLAKIFKDMLSRIKISLQDPPYNLVLHTSPPVRTRPGKPNYWSTIELDYHWHFELIPRLTRIAGFEWGAGFFINPTPPETAAEYLRKIEIEI